MLLDNADQLEENPKVFELTRQNSTCTLEHACWIFFEDSEVPEYWSDTQVQKFKQDLTKFL